MDLDSAWPDTVSMVFSHEDMPDIVFDDITQEPSPTEPPMPEPQSDCWALMGLVLALWGLTHSRRLNTA
jgi:hypothetical protein